MWERGSSERKGTHRSEKGLGAEREQESTKKDLLLDTRLLGVQGSSRVLGEVLDTGGMGY